MNPRDIIWTIQLEVYCTMLHTKFGDPEPYGFWQADFLGLSLYKPLENKVPTILGPLWTQGV